MIDTIRVSDKTLKPIDNPRLCNLVLNHEVSGETDAKREQNGILNYHFSISIKPGLIPRDWRGKTSGGIEELKGVAVLALVLLELKERK